MIQRLTNKRINAVLDRIDICTYKGRRFRKMVAKYGLKKAYETAVHEAYDNIPTRATIPFDWFDITVPIQTLILHATNKIRYIYDSPPTTNAKSFLRMYPYEQIYKWAFMVAQGLDNEQRRAA